MVETTFVDRSKLQAFAGLVLHETYDKKSNPKYGDLLDNATQVFSGRGEDVVPGTNQRFEMRMATLPGMEEVYDGVMLPLWTFNGNVIHAWKEPDRHVPVAADKFRLLYSFVYNSIDPEYAHDGEPFGRIFRDTIEKMFEVTGVGKPMTADEVAQNSRALIAIFQENRKKRGGIPDAASL